MSVISSLARNTVGAGLNAVGQSVRGAVNGELGDVAKVAVVAGMALGSVPVATGAAVLAGGQALGTLIDIVV